MGRIKTALEFKQAYVNVWGKIKCSIFKLLWRACLLLFLFPIWIARNVKTESPLQLVTHTEFAGLFVQYSSSTVPRNIMYRSSSFWWWKLLMFPVSRICSIETWWEAMGVAEVSGWYSFIFVFFVSLVWRLAFSHSHRRWKETGGLSVGGNWSVCTRLKIWRLLKSYLDLSPKVFLERPRIQIRTCFEQAWEINMMSSALAKRTQSLPDRSRNNTFRVVGPKSGACGYPWSWPVGGIGVMRMSGIGAVQDADGKSIEAHATRVGVTKSLEAVEFLKSVFKSGQNPRSHSRRPWRSTQFTGAQNTSARSGEWTALDTAGYASSLEHKQWDSKHTGARANIQRTSRPSAAVEL